MANATNRFYGIVGYAPTEVNDTGIATASIIPRPYYGNVLRSATKWQETDNLNDDITVSNRISIVADPYAIQNFPYIKYVEWMGTRWTVRSVDEEYPRLILTLGGVYNGPQA